MDQLIQALLKTDNVAILVLLAACAACGYMHLLDRKERRQRDKDAASERAAFFSLIRDNTNAMHALRQAISLLTKRDL